MHWNQVTAPGERLLTGGDFIAMNFRLAARSLSPALARPKSRIDPKRSLVKVR
jgi:hypothetical protein